jgi:hypothetical protein
MLIALLASAGVHLQLPLLYVVLYSHEQRVGDISRWSASDRFPFNVVDIGTFTPL